MYKRTYWYEFAHKKEPNINILRQALDNDDFDRNQIKAIRLKYQALIAEPTIIEKKPCHLNSCLMCTIHSGRGAIPFKNCMIGLNIANRSMVMTEWTLSLK